MGFNINEIDKNNFKCFKFENNSLYFGEIIYMDENNNKIQEEDVKDSEIESYKLFRHGYGVELFYKNDNQIYSKYEGCWDMNKQEGSCNILYPNGNSFNGIVKDGKKEGDGEFIWVTGEIYFGQWKDDKMHGHGVLNKLDQKQYNGIFRNNMYFHNGIYINPFETEKEIQTYLKYKEKTDSIKEKIDNENNFFFISVNINDKSLINQIKKSNGNNRIPLLFFERNSNLSLKNIIKTDYFNSHSIFDLRLAHTTDNIDNYLKEINNSLVNWIKNGGIFIINIDESDVEYNEPFDPNIKEFFNWSNFPAQILNFKEFKTPEIYKNIINDEEKKNITMHKDFHIIIYSKIKFDNNYHENRIKEKVERRFRLLFDINMTDLIMISK